MVCVHNMIAKIINSYSGVCVKNAHLVPLTPSTKDCITKLEPSSRPTPHPISQCCGTGGRDKMRFHNSADFGEGGGAGKEEAEEEEDKQCHTEHVMSVFYACAKLR